MLKKYISCVDDKNVEGMLEHITIPLDLHYGSQQVTTIKSKDEFAKLMLNEKRRNAETSFFMA